MHSENKTQGTNYNLVFCCFANHPKAHQRLLSRAAEAKSKYLISQFSGFDKELLVLVNSPLLNPNESTDEESFVDGGISYRYAPSAKRNNKLVRFFDNRSRGEWLYKTLVNCCSKDSIVVIYHSPSIIGPVSRAKKKVGFKLVVEVEELYAYMPDPKISLERELAFLRKGDAFIPATKSIDKAVNKNRKPSVVYYGTYLLPEAIKKMVFTDELKHVVFAGTFTGLNRGLIALAVARYLPNGYAMEILPSGDSEKSLQIVTDFKAKNKTDCKITIHQTKTGDDFTDFLQSCQVGLSVQDDKTTFSSFSFPSKVIVYLSCGLPVVSTKLQVLTDSPFASCITQVENNDPEKLAEAILASSKVGSSKDCILSVRREAANFAKDLSMLIKQLR